MSLAVPSLAPAVQTPTLAVRRRRISRVAWWWIAGVVFAAGVLLVGTPVADGDTGSDLLDSFGAILRNVGRMPWTMAPVLAVVAALHYVAAALALRAAAGVRLPIRETTWVQLAAAAANRLTPAGLGGATVNARYLRRKDARVVQALATVGILGGLGALADIIVFACLVFAGRWVGISGGSHELAALGHKVNGPWHAFTSLPWPATFAIAAAVAAGAAVGLIRARRRRAGNAGTGAAAGPQVWPLLWELVRSPKRMAVLLAASGATTLLLATGFALTALAASPGSGAGFGGLVIGFLIGGAVGTAVPAPAGIGSTEAALVGVLLVAHIPATTAISTVLMFRLITFWAPAIVGLGAIRLLRRRQVL